MKHLLITLAVGLSFTGCTRHNSQVKEATVAQTAEAVKTGAATVLDANDDEYRKAAGVVPTAVLLSSFNAYALNELPADKTRPLVFYCTSRL
jgi:hypothetical protein